MRRLDEVAAAVGLPLGPIEEAARDLVALESGLEYLSPLELVSTPYFDGLCAEMDEVLRAAGSRSLGSFATEHDLPVDVLRAAVQARVGSVMCAQLSGGILYTEAFVQAQRAQVRGAFRGVTRPTPVSAIAHALGMDQAALEAHMAEIDLAGKVRGGDFVPEIFSKIQRAGVDRFLHANGFLPLSTAKRMQLAKGALDFVRESFPGAVQLETAIVTGSVAGSVEASVREAVGSQSFVDVATLVPSELTAADLAKLLARCPEIGRRSTSKSAKAVVIGESNVVSKSLLEALRKEVGTAAAAAAQQAAEDQDQCAGSDEYTIVTTGAGPAGKGAKGKGKGKGAKGRADGPEARLRRELERRGSPSRISQVVAQHVPALEHEGSAPLLRMLAAELAPDFEASFSSAFTELTSSAHTAGAAGRLKRQSTLEETFLELFSDLQVFARSVDALEADSGADVGPLAALFVREFVYPLAGLLVEHQCLQQEVDYDAFCGAAPAGRLSGRMRPSWGSPELCRAAVAALAKGVLREQLERLLARCDNCEERPGRFQALASDLADAAKACSLVVRAVDKRGERAIMHAHRLKLLRSLAACTDEARLLAIASALMLQQGRQWMLPVLGLDDAKAASGPGEWKAAYQCLAEPAASLLEGARLDAWRALSAGTADPAVLEAVRTFAADKSLGATDAAAAAATSTT